MAMGILWYRTTYMFQWKLHWPTQDKPKSHHSVDLIQFPSFYHSPFLAVDFPTVPPWHHCQFIRATQNPQKTLVLFFTIERWGCNLNCWLSYQFSSFTLETIGLLSLGQLPTAPRPRLVSSIFEWASWRVQSSNSLASGWGPFDVIKRGWGISERNGEFHRVIPHKPGLSIRKSPAWHGEFHLELPYSFLVNREFRCDSHTCPIWRICWEKNGDGGIWINHKWGISRQYVGTA